MEVLLGWFAVALFTLIAFSIFFMILFVWGGWYLMEDFASIFWGVNHNKKEKKDE